MFVIISGRNIKTYQCTEVEIVSQYERKLMENLDWVFTR